MIVDLILVLLTYDYTKIAFQIQIGQSQSRILLTLFPVHKRSRLNFAYDWLTPSFEPNGVSNSVSKRDPHFHIRVSPLESPIRIRQPKTLPLTPEHENK